LNLTGLIWQLHKRKEPTPWGQSNKTFTAVRYDFLWTYVTIVHNKQERLSLSSLTTRISGTQ